MRNWLTISGISARWIEESKKLGDVCRFFCFLLILSGMYQIKWIALLSISFLLLDFIQYLSSSLGVLILKFQVKESNVYISDKNDKFQDYNEKLDLSEKIIEWKGFTLFLGIKLPFIIWCSKILVMILTMAILTTHIINY